MNDDRSYYPHNTQKGASTKTVSPCMDTRVCDVLGCMSVCLCVSVCLSVCVHECMYMSVYISGQQSLFSGATFHIPLTKSATLNRLLHCSLWSNFQGLFFCTSGAKSPGAPRVIISLVHNFFSFLSFCSRLCQ